MKLGHVLAFYGILAAILIGLGTRTDVECPLWVTISIVSIFLTSVIAAIAMEDLNRRDRFVEVLSVPQFTPLYDQFSGWLINWELKLFSAEPPDPDTRNDAEIVRDCFSYRLLDRAMLFAVVYPILLLVVFWSVSGRDGTLGGVVVIPAAIEPYHRYATIGGLVTISLSLMMGRRMSTSPQRFLRIAAVFLPVLITFGTAIGLVGIGVPPLVAGAVAVAGVAAFAISIGAPVAVAFLVVFIGITAVVVAVSFASLIAGVFLVTIPLAVGLVGFVAVAVLAAVARAIPALNLRGWGVVAAAVAVLAPASALAIAVFFSYRGASPMKFPEECFCSSAYCHC